MAVEQGKVIAKLNEVLKGKSVTENYKKSLATKWAARIETDEDIDSFIDDRKDDILEASTEADRRATQAAKKAREDAAKAASGDTSTGDEEKKPELPADMPEWAKMLIEQNKTLHSEVTGLKAAKQAETVESMFLKDDRLKGIPPAFLKRAVPKSAEEIEATVAEVTNEWKEIQAQNNFAGFGGDKPAARFGGASKVNAATEEKPDEAVANYAKAQNEKFIQEQSKN